MERWNGGGGGGAHFPSVFFLDFGNPSCWHWQPWRLKNLIRGASGPWERALFRRNSQTSTSTIMLYNCGRISSGP